jgi:Phospholipase_D-nuclease N-terminal
MVWSHEGQTEPLSASGIGSGEHVWLLVAVRIVRRRDLGFVGKLFWLVFILVVPLVGLFIYFLWDAASGSQ